MIGPNASHLKLKSVCRTQPLAQLLRDELDDEHIEKLSIISINAKYVSNELRTWRRKTKLLDQRQSVMVENCPERHRSFVDNFIATDAEDEALPSSTSYLLRQWTCFRRRIKMGEIDRRTGSLSRLKFPRLLLQLMSKVLYIETSNLRTFWYRPQVNACGSPISDWREPLMTPA